VAGTLVVVLVGGLATASEAGRARNRVPEGQATAVFDGTPLEGARITGRLGGIIDTYGGLVVQAYRENEEFYARADDALLAAWDEWAAADARREAGDADEGGDEATDGSTDEPSAEPSASPTPSDEDTVQTVEPVTLLVISDLHCNVGMAPLITTLAERSGAQIVLDAGDTTMNGTSVEQYCVSTIARAVPDGVTLVTAPGNHDSAQTTEQYARAGATVLDGEVIEVAGMRLIGDHDPKVTRVAAETTQDESYPDVAARLRQACAESDGVDLAIFHNPRIAPKIFDGGCIPAMVSGHMHTRTDPEQVGEGIRYISGSTAGAVDNAPRIGPLRGIAEMTLLRWDPTTRRILDWQLVEIDPDAQATVHDRERWPVAVPDPDPEADEVGTESGTEPTGTPTPEG
jgi:predicted phosphodiesterase